MDEQIFGAKELYDVCLKATYDMDINGKRYVDGETVVRFGRIQIAQLNGKYSHVSAKGGYDNRELVCWDEMKSIGLNFSQGVFTKRQLAFLMNSGMVQNLTPEKKMVPMSETLEADGNGRIELKFLPAEKLFVYGEDGLRADYIQENKVLSGFAPFETLTCDYYWEYTDPIAYFQTGLQITNGFLRLEGKTRLKDDNTGKIVTGIITIPRLKLKTGISVRLGANAEPVVGSFQGEGYPVGARSNKTVGSLVILSDDIDSDF